MFGQTAPKNRVPETFILPPNGRMPNSHLPVVFYRDVAPASEDLEPYFRRLFNHNHWGGDWAMGIYGYHHFHSNAHEVLGIAAGSATLVLGGDGGRLLEVTRGDVLVLPAGTGHRRIKDSWDFWVVGAYPRGQEDYDEFTDHAMCTNCVFRLRRVALPQQDPVFGKDGKLPRLWGEVGLTEADNSR